MKKILLLLFLAISFMACEGPIGPSGLNGRDGKDGTNGKDGANGHSSNWKIKTFTINANEWVLQGKPNDLDSYYYVDKPLSELTSDIFKEGVVVAYIESAQGIKNGLPYLWYRGAPGDKTDYLWTEKYDFDFYPGGVSFYVTFSDFMTSEKPGTETFHVVLMW